MTRDDPREQQAEAVSALIRDGAHREALSICAGTLGPELGRFCMVLLGSQEQAQETLEELMVVFYDAMPQLGDRPLRPFLFGTALELCMRRLRDSEPEAVYDARSSAPPGEQTRAALCALKRVERNTALLHFMAGLSYAEVAQICEVPEDEVVKRAGRALLEMRQHIHGVEG